MEREPLVVIGIGQDGPAGLSAAARPLAKAELDVVRNFLKSGKPLVGIRTSNHAFALRPGMKFPPGKEPPEGLEEWSSFEGGIPKGFFARKPSRFQPVYAVYVSQLKS